MLHTGEKPSTTSFPRLALIWFHIPQVPDVVVIRVLPYAIDAWIDHTLVFDRFLEVVFPNFETVNIPAVLISLESHLNMYCALRYKRIIPFTW